LKFIVGAKGPPDKIIKAKLLENVKGTKDRFTLRRIIVENNGEEMIAYTKTHQGSGNLHSMVVANALTLLPPGKNGNKNEIIDVLFF
jgi:molybdopterin biosynthesis enzyme